MLLMCSLSLGSFAQKLKLVEGDLKSLAGQQEINTEFDYSQMNAAHVRGSIEGIAGSDTVNLNLLDNEELLELD